MQHHENFAVGHAAARASNRSFGFGFAVVFAVIGLKPLWHHEPMRVSALLTSAFLAAIAILRPAWLEVANRVWMAVGDAAGNVVGSIVMVLIYFAVVTPIAIAMRVAHKDPLRRARDPAARTYWIDRTPPGPPPESMRNQF